MYFPVETSITLQRSSFKIRTWFSGGKSWRLPLPTHPNSKDWLSGYPSRRKRAVSISPFSIHQTEFFTVIRIAVNDDIVIAVLIRDISIYKRRYFTAAQHQSLHVVEVLYNAQPILAKINVLIYRRNNFGIVYVDCAWTWVRWPYSTALTTFSPDGCSTWRISETGQISFTLFRKQGRNSQKSTSRKYLPAITTCIVRTTRSSPE